MTDDDYRLYHAMNPEMAEFLRRESMTPDQRRLDAVQKRINAKRFDNWGAFVMLNAETRVRARERDEKTGGK